MNIKELSQKAEYEYTNCPPSGRGDGSLIITKEQIIETLKPISIRKPLAMIVGSVATQNKSDNDIDIVIRGEDFSPKLKESIDFRLYRHFSDLFKCKYDDIRKYVHIHYNDTGSYTSYVPLFELFLQPMTNTETIEMSDDSMHMNITGNFNILEKSSDNDRIIAGYASVVEVDQENQIIPKSALEEGIKTLLQDTNYSNLMLVHKNIQIGKILPSYGDLITHVDDKGLFIVAEIRKDLEISNQVWNKILEGGINAFSISGEVILDHEECDDKKCVEVVDKINIFEVSVCSSPVNKDSGFIVVSKGDSVCNNVNKGIKIIKRSGNMTDNPQPPCKDCVPSEEKPIENKDIEQKEVPLKEVIEIIQREITAIKGVIEELKAKKPEEEKPMEVPADKPEDKPVEVPQDKPEDKIPMPGKPEEPSQYPYPSKKDFDELKKSVTDLVGIITKNKKIEELEIAVKSKDDEIAGLLSRVEILSKAETEPKTTIKEPEKKIVVNDMFNEDVRQKSGDLTVPVKSDMKIPEPKEVSLVKDPITPGVYYKDPDMM